jgi:uncharacterized protein involved in exopolysaccharide biosynthesis
MSMPEVNQLAVRQVREPAGRPGYDGGDPEEVSLLGLVNVVLRYRAFVVGMMLAVALLISASVLLQPRVYAATAKFVPQSRNATSNLGGLAAQFGLAMPGDPGQSPQFYVDLITSREILGSVVSTPFTYPTDSGTITTTLVDLYGRGAERPQLRREAAIDQLRNRVDGEISAATSVVTVKTTASNPVLAKEITARTLALVNEFNLARRKSQAAAERRFTQQRLDEVKRDLRDAENRLQRFLEGNRSLALSPALKFEQQRLERGVALQQQLYTNLSQAYEQAKIDEVRDTPVITVVEEPEVPVRPEPRGLIRKGLLGLALGAILGIVLAFARDFLSRSRAERSPDFVEFVELRQAAVDDLKHPWRPVARLFGRRSGAV